MFKRMLFQEGPMSMPEEDMPLDTYPNIPPDEMEEALEALNFLMKKWKKIILITLWMNPLTMKNKNI